MNDSSGTSGLSKEIHRVWDSTALALQTRSPRHYMVRRQAGDIGVKADQLPGRESMYLCMVLI